MKKILSKKHKGFLGGLAFVLFFCLTLQAPLMSYAMNGMDCKTKITCAACGCVLNSVNSPLYLSSFFIELTPPAEFQVPTALLIQEPRIRPPK